MSSYSSFKKTVKKVSSWLVYTAFLSLSVILLLETAYRFYLIDFYATNLYGLNTDAELKTTDKKSILVIGDSFSADKQSYVKQLRDSLPSYRVINSAVAGTTIAQHQLMWPNRLQTFQPDILIYQIYIGNDLIEYRHETSGNISWLRKIYWTLSDHLRVLAYLNARLAIFKHIPQAGIPTSVDTKTIEHFDVNKYNTRSKILFRAEPHALENSILLKGKRAKDTQNYLSALEDMLAQVADDCQVYLLLMPHCVQLNDTYQKRMQSIGAQFSSNNSLQNIDYPFAKAIMKLNAANIHIINPLRALQLQDSLSPCYYSNDPHLNKWGQEVVARQLLKELEPLK